MKYYLFSQEKKKELYKRGTAPEWSHIVVFFFFLITTKVAGSHNIDMTDMANTEDQTPAHAGEVPTWIEARLSPHSHPTF